MKWIRHIKSYFERKKNPLLDTFALEVLGGKEERQKYAEFLKIVDLDCVLEILSIRKEREERSREPLTAVEFLSFFKSCAAEIENEIARKEMEGNKKERRRMF
jgi:DNA-directed RNA polymerase